MHPLFYVGGVAALYFYFKNKKVQLVDAGMTPGAGLTMPTTPATTTQPDPSVMQSTPAAVPNVPATAAPAGTLLGYGGGGFPFFSDGKGGIYGGPDGKSPVTADKTLLLHGKQYVWRVQADGSLVWDPTATPSWTPTATSPGMDGYRRFARR